jgi:branched-chain amino acid transport system permease protein
LKLWGGIGALILFLVIWPLVYPEQFFIHISIFFFLSLIGTVSLNLMMRTGLLSFAHAGFMGIGAYTSTLLMMKMHFPFILAFCMAGVVPGLVALGVGPIVLRLKGVYFVLISFLLGEVIRLVFVNWGSVFGGSGGIFNIPAASIGFAGHSISFVSKTSVYYLAMVVAIMASILSSISSSPSPWGPF